MWHIIDAQSQQPVSLDSIAWPMLIHGRPKSGASFFTVALAAELVRRGESVVWLCERAEGVMALRRELGQPEVQVKGRGVTESNVEELEDSGLVTMFAKRPSVLMNWLRNLPHWDRRVVFLKNMETTLSKEFWGILKTHVQLVVSG